MVAPVSEYLLALFSRLAITCDRRTAIAVHASRAGRADRSRRCCRCASMSGRDVSTAMAIASAMSIGSRRSSTLPRSTRDTSSRSSTMRTRCCTCRSITACSRCPSASVCLRIFSSCTAVRIGRQRIAQLVREQRQEVVLLAIGLLERLLGEPPFGDVHHREQQDGDRAPSVLPGRVTTSPRATTQRTEPSACAKRNSSRVRLRVPRRMREARHHVGAVVGVDAPLDVGAAATRLAGRQAADLTAARVGQHVVLVGHPGHRAELGDVEREARALLALAQLDLREAALVDVGAGADPFLDRAVGAPPRHHARAVPAVRARSARSRCAPRYRPGAGGPARRATAPARARGRRGGWRPPSPSRRSPTRPVRSRPARIPAARRSWPDASAVQTMAVDASTSER